MHNNNTKPLMPFNEYILTERVIYRAPDVEREIKNKNKPTIQTDANGLPICPPAKREMDREDILTAGKAINTSLKRLGLNITVIVTHHSRDDRIGHARNVSPISKCELYRVFYGVFKKYGKEIEASIPKTEHEDSAFQFIITDTQTNLNVVCAANWRRSINSNALRMKTVMRKKGFVPNNPREKHYKI